MHCGLRIKRGLIASSKIVSDCVHNVLDYKNLTGAVVDRFAAHIHARGIRPGDFVAIFTTNSPEMVVTIYALAKLGAVAAMINTNLRGKLSQFIVLEAI